MENGEQPPSPADPIPAADSRMVRLPLSTQGRIRDVDVPENSDLAQHLAVLDAAGIEHAVKLSASRNYVWVSLGSPTADNSDGQAVHYARASGELKTREVGIGRTAWLTLIDSLNRAQGIEQKPDDPELEL
jgi:subtilisin family serine protease